MTTLDGEDCVWSEVQSAALDAALGIGTASDDEDGQVFSVTESQQQSDSEAADSAAELDCCSSHYRKQPQLQDHGLQHIIETNKSV